MKENVLLYFFVLITFGTGCSTNKQLKEDIPCIDVRKNYTEKEIVLTEIADVTFVHLSTENDDYIYKGAIRSVTENTFVVIDISTGSILFFSKEGNPKSRFNRFGEGPQEYPLRNFSITYNESTDDVYVNCTPYPTAGSSISVYSSTGEFRRKLMLPQGSIPLPVIDYDDQSLFIYDNKKIYEKLKWKETDFTTQLFDSSYCRISKTDGVVLEYIEFPDNNINLTDRGDKNNKFYESYKRVFNNDLGLFICNPETDTVFLYGKDKILTPVICKTPLVSNKNPKVVMTDFLDTKKYHFIQVQTLFTHKERINIQRDKEYKNYIYDKQTGEIFRQKISLPDYKGKEFYILAATSYFYGKETTSLFLLDLLELKDAYKENRLSGKLKELVATLDENKDNEVYMFARFR